MTILYSKYKSLSVSLLLHLVILVFLAALVVVPSLGTRWLEFAYISEEDLLEDNSINQQLPALKKEAGPVTREKIVASSTPTKQAPNNSEIIPDENTSLNTSGIEPIEMPRSQFLIHKPKDITLPVNPGIKGLLLNLAAANTSSNGGLNIDIEGGGIIPILPSGIKHSLGEPGWVILSFELDDNARVIGNSILAIQQSNNRFIDEAKSVLAKCSFRFKGTPNTEREYRIRINFS